MPTSNRLDEIRARITHAREGSHTARYMVLDVDAPALTEAVSAILDLHTESRLGPDLPHPYCGECGQMLPCATRRAIAATLGEEA